MANPSSAAAERYARAVFELGVEAGDADALVGKVRDFAALYAGSSDLRNILENPLVTADERVRTLRELGRRLGLSDLALTVLRYLASRRRLRLLPEIARRLARLLDDEQGVVRAQVTAASRLPELFYERLARELEGLVGRKVTLERKEDPSLIAGVVTRIGDNTIDGSLRGRLEHIERRLLG